MKQTRRFAGFRLNPEKDQDIIEDLARYKNTSERMKVAYRKALLLEKTPTLQGKMASNKLAAFTAEERASKSEPVLAGPSNKEVSKTEKSAVKSNILNSF